MFYVFYRFRSEYLQKVSGLLVQSSVFYTGLQCIDVGWWGDGAGAAGRCCSAERRDSCPRTHYLTNHPTLAQIQIQIQITSIGCANANFFFLLDKICWHDETGQKSFPIVNVATCAHCRGPSIPASRQIPQLFRPYNGL